MPRLQRRPRASQFEMPKPKRNQPTTTYPEPGAWVMGDPSPYRLPPGPLSSQEIQVVVAHEGLGFSIYSLVKASRIKDPKLRKLWAQARLGMQRVMERLEGGPAVVSNLIDQDLEEVDI